MTFPLKIIGNLKTKTPINPNLVGYWPFLGNADDSIAGNDGTVHGATLVPDHNGNPDSAYSFDGGDWIDVGDVLDMRLSDWSISTRINTAFINTSGIIFKGTSGSFNGRYGLLTVAGGLLGFIQPGAPLSTTVASGPGTKYVTVTYDRSGLLSIYIDTVFKVSVDISSGELFDMVISSSLTFGGFSGPTLMYTGTIDFVKIYNKVIDAAEMTIDNAL